MKNVLKEKDKYEKSNCVLWAFNYKNFEKYSTFVVKKGLKSQIFGWLFGRIFVPRI